MELNDTELNYKNFGDEADSDNASNDSDEDFVLQKSLFYFKQFSIVRSSEGFSIIDIPHWKTHFVFLNVKFSCFFLLKPLFYIQVILILLKMPILLELRFYRNMNIYKVYSFKDFQDVVFVSKSFLS